MLIKDQESVPNTMSGGYATAALHPEEEKRLFDLMGYEILDEGTDPILDRVAELAATVCNVPIAMVSLVDKDRTIVKAAHGITSTVIPRDVSLCAFSILETGDLFVIPDTHKDPRFANNPVVTGKPFVRFYAGAPLLSADQLPIGSLCVIDQVPKEITPFERTMLLKIAGLAMARIEARLYSKNLEHLLSLEKNIYNRFLHSATEMAIESPSFDSALHHLMENLDPRLGWLSARVRNMQTGGTSGIIGNPCLPKDIDISGIWQKIDTSPSHSSATTPYTEFVSLGSVDQSYSHLVVPVRVRNRLVALMEFIYPDHRRMETRIRDIFDLMASNLAIVAERELVHIELQHQATHDPLTDAANRPLIISEIQRCLLNTDPIQPDTAVVFIDIDGFKEINDNFGHEIGDQLLIEVGKRLRAAARENDLLGRLSGDEFILILKEMRTTGDLPALLKRIWHSVSLPYAVGELEIKITGSIGCALLTENEISPGEVMRRAEEAMYLVKNGQRREFCIVDDEVIGEMRQRRHLDHKVREAVQNNRMFLLFQPIVDISTAELKGAETLFRLFERDGEMMTAASFMESLKRSKYLPMIDDWVLTEACRAFSGQGAPLLKLPGFRFSVNVSPPILSTRGYAKRWIEELEQNGINPSSLTIEITESDLLTSNETVIENLSLLRSTGVGIAIDDFGTGYSNLQYLSSLPIDTVKIDKSFLHGIRDNEVRTPALLDFMISLSLKLGYHTIVEGVEEALQADHLKKMGCHYGQGYLYGKPMPMEELIALSQKNP